MVGTHAALKLLLPLSASTNHPHRRRCKSDSASAIVRVPNPSQPPQQHSAGRSAAIADKPGEAVGPYGGYANAVSNRCRLPYALMPFGHAIITVSWRTKQVHALPDLGPCLNTCLQINTTQGTSKDAEVETTWLVLRMQGSVPSEEPHVTALLRQLCRMLCHVDHLQMQRSQ